ncbi:MAG: hypothetical protein FWB99_11195 [Treponema sp.]|nr:hypothetical protein [Treponema sp.]
MKSKNILGFFFAIFLSAAPGAYAQVLEGLTAPQHAAALRAGDSPVLVQFSSPQPQLIPQHEILRRHVEATRRDLGPSVMVEILYLYRKPPQAERTAWTQEEKTRLYNELVALSTLAGLQYFSSSRGTMWTLYETSQVIDGPSSRRPIPDPVFARPPAELTMYVSQRDLTFGDNIYQFTFHTSPGALIITQQNVTALSVGIIRAVGRNNLRSTVAILDAGEYILVYAAAMARAASLPGMRERIGSSFTTRTEAIIQWFSGQADRAFSGAY